MTAPAHATGAVEFVSLDDVALDDRFRLRPDGDVAGLASSLGRLGQLVPVELRPLPDAAEGGPRWQVVAGFRRLAALRLLFRDRVLARLHQQLPDDEAWALAIAQAVLGEPFTVADLEALRGRLEGEGVAQWAGEILDEAIARAPLDPELREKFFEFLKGPLAPVVQRFDVDPDAARPADVAALVEPSAQPEPERAAEPQPERAVEPQPEIEEVVEVDPDDLVKHLALRLYDVNQDLAAAFASWKELPREGRDAVLAQARYVAELFPFLVEASRE
jgi:ParB family transcriptional regulator, chromosome partitioning protein